MLSFDSGGDCSGESGKEEGTEINYVGDSINVDQRSAMIGPTNSNYARSKKLYRKKIIVKSRKVEIEAEETLFGAGKDKPHGIKGMQSSVEKFFRDSGTVNSVSVTNDRSGSVENLSVLVEEMIEKEFPIKDQIPSGRQLINVGELEQNRSVYSPGDWVEIEGLDMKWRVDMITRVIKQAPESYDWNDPKNEGKEPKWTYTYNAGTERDVEAHDLRTPETGLLILFGKRPWVWQQYAMLKLENKLRFQKGHQDDFMELDIQKYASDLWERWLEDPANIEFKELFYDERIGEKGRMLLTSHITKPFELIDVMGEENKEWDFKDDDNINVFTYLSMHGSGIVLPLLVLTIQLVIPFLLVLDTNKKRASEGCTSGEELNYDLHLSKIMTLVVFVYYTFSIIPETYTNFFNVAGAADTVYSRLLSIRRGLWLQADDNLLQMIGYKLDIYMNTSYETVLSMLNIYVLLNTEEAIEVILNALAFTFIARIDEDLIKSYWYDPEKRWITAGAMSVAIQTKLQLRVLESPKLFALKFDIHEKLLRKVTNNDSNFLRSKYTSQRDADNMEFMTNAEKIELVCASVAIKAKNKSAIDEYRKPKRYFGSIEKVLRCLLRNRPVFEKFADYRTWSYWNKIMYLSPVPDLDTIFETDGDEDWVVSSSLEEMRPPFPNFHPEDDETNEWVLFVRHVWSVLILKDVRDSTRPALACEHYGSATFRLIDGLFFNWLSYFLHIVFPIYLILAIYETTYNIVARICYNPFFEVIYYVQVWMERWF
mmetsp:Transcript_16158/g.24215  ORF Transcript_16158/g.24215 Transcript_16158/m.24215 type:complete len:767 (-) Transcript_16158:215-2515(-)